MYIHPETLSNQSTPAAGLLELTPEQEALYLQYNGFIIITSTDPVEIEPDINAWEAWKEWEAAQPEPTPPPEYVTYADLAAAIREGVNAV